MAEQFDVQTLGRIGEVEVATAITSAPWELPVEALVFSVGSTPGGVAAGARTAFPTADWRSLAAEPVPTGTARVMRVPEMESPGSSPEFFVVAGVGDGQGGPAAALEAVVSAEVEALGAALDLGVSSLALPILGAGALGLDLDEAAGAAVAVVREQLPRRFPGHLRRVVFVGMDDSVRRAVEQAWARQDGPGDRRKPFSDLSSSALEVLGHATAVSADRLLAGVVDGPLLLLCALTRRRGDLGGVSGELGRLLAGNPSRLPELLQRLAGDLFVPVESLDKEPSSVLAIGPAELIVDRARALARRTATDQVHLRHLLAAVVTEPLPESVPAALGTTAEELRTHVRAGIAATVPDEAPAVWDQILLPPVEIIDLAGGYSRDTVDDTERIALTEDRLGVGTYVSMLATVIARRDTPLPLSIGLFGEWGSGKSYFMGLLRGRIQALSESGDEAYWREIVPITFNAWHYADTNLWASLGNEIFEQLAGPGASAAEHREAIRDELAEKTDRAQELRTAHERAEQETARLRDELDSARAEAAGSAATLLRAATASPTVQELLRRAWGRLGVSEEVEREQLLASELRQASGDVDAVRLALRGPAGWTPLVLAAAALGLLLLSAVFAGNLARWLAGGGVAGLVAAVTGAGVVVRRVRNGMRLLTAAASEIRAQADRSTEVAVAAERSRLLLAEARAAVLQTQLSEVLQRVGDLDRELAELDPGRRWYGFVSERAASSDYRRELGLISTIRRDFEQLIELMAEWSTAERPDEQHRPIDRIVLYIDDLDRCSSKQVVDVLQAVHLLLALDLFVVVVGVDPRWLLHSLREQYRTAFRPTGDDVPEAGDDDAVWRTTPHDYLEKIFNIPFVLPGMTATSFEHLIRRLSLGEADGRGGPGGTSTDGGDSGGGSGRSGNRPAGGVAGSTGAGASGGQPGMPPEVEGAAAEITSESGSEVTTGGTAAGPLPRLLTEDELALLASLGPLVRSPRQAKRLLNLYRMVRSTRDLSPASDFLGSESAPGEYQAVGVLLGLLTAHPRLLGRILAAEPTDTLRGGISHRDPQQSWRDVVAGLRPRRPDDAARNDAEPERHGPDTGWHNDVCTDMSDADRLEWCELVERVAAATALVRLPDLTAFRFWGPRLARFSFVLSPLAAGTEEPIRGGTVATDEPGATDEPAGSSAAVPA